MANNIHCFLKLTETSGMERRDYSCLGLAPSPWSLPRRNLLPVSVSCFVYKQSAFINTNVELTLAGDVFTILTQVIELTLN